MRYAVAIAASRPTGYSYTVGVIEGVSNEDEATGKALRICHARYPELRGFFNHSAAVLKIEDTVIEVNP
jgi:hypothetical protein